MTDYATLLRDRVRLTVRSSSAPAGIHGLTSETGHVRAAPVGAQIHTEWSLEPRGASDTPARQRDEVVLLTITWPVRREALRLADPLPSRVAMTR
jgi:hypothetical protein